LAAQTAQAHVIVVVAQPVPVAKRFDVASGVDARLSTYLFGETFSSNPQKFSSLPFTYRRFKNGTASPPRRAKGRSLPGRFRCNKKGTPMAVCF
jgi:hypothetical protein